MLNNLINKFKRFIQNLIIFSNKFIDQMQWLFSKFLGYFNNIKTANKSLTSTQLLAFLKNMLREYIKFIIKSKFFAKVHQQLLILITGSTNDISGSLIPEGVLGICIDNNNIILVHLVSNVDANFVIKSYKIIDFKVSDLNFQDIQEKSEIQKVISDYIQKNQLAKVAAVYVLSPLQYVISLVEFPKDKVMTKDKAILWSVKDYINYSIDDAILDTFDVPANRSQDNVKLSYAVAMRAKLSQDIGELLYNCKIQLKYIDINELCIRNLIQLYPELNPIGCLVLKVSEYDHHILLIKNNCLFISRSTKLNIKSLNGFDPINQHSEEQFSIAEGLLLELQRSLDYANSMFRGLNFNYICVLCGSYNLDKLIIWLQEQSGLGVKKIDLSVKITSEHDIGSEINDKLAVAIGGALRNFVIKE